MQMTDVVSNHLHNDMQFAWPCYDQLSEPVNFAGRVTLQSNQPTALSVDDRL